MTELRLRGTPNLMDAANQAGARIVFQSIALAYAPDTPAGVPARLHTEDDPIFGAEAPAPWNVAMPAIAALEERAVDSGGLVLRYGMFYGPHTHFAPGGQQYEDVRRRRFPLPGRGTGVCSFIHVDDAAAATVAAIAAGATGILNVVDDEPIALHEWLALYAQTIGAKTPLRAPLWLARLVSGPLPLHFATTLPGASNAKAKRELGWAPGYSSVREGFRRASPTRLARTEYVK
jgi:nucleoside-diphosphate-sugar epimerase